MGIADEKNRNGKTENSLLEAEGDTQILECDSPSATEANFLDPDDLGTFQTTVQYSETFPLDDGDLKFETELVGEVNNLEGATQVLEDFETQVVEDLETYADECNQIVPIDCDQEETGTTEVLSAREEVSVDMAASSIMKDFYDGTNICEEVSSLERCSISPLCLHEEERKNFLVDSDASAEEEYISGGLQTSSLQCKKSPGQKKGCSRKSFTSVRSASLRFSGLAAARSMTPKSANTGSNPIEENNKTPPCGFNTVNNNNMVISSRGVPPFSGTEGGELGQDSEDRFSEDPRNRTRTGTVRKLFAMDPSGEMDDTERGDHDLAGLSYVDSQEPGELSKANALNIVDKYLKINDIELFEEGELVRRESVKGKSSPMSVLKGRVTLAQKANPGVSVVEAGIFDWVDSHEDEGGGDFFTKRKDVLLGSRDHLRISKTEPRKSKHLTFRGKGDFGLNFEEREGNDPQIHQKLVGLVCSDSRFVLDRSRKGDKVLPTETKAKKSISKVLDKQCSEDPICDVVGSQATYVVGFDTQLAAEAMEALCCAPSAEHCDEDRRNTIIDQRRKTICSKRIVRKRASPTTDFEGRMKPSKQRKIHDAISSNSRLKHMQLEPAEKTKARGMQKVHLTRSAVKSSKSTGENRRQADGVIHNKEMATCHASVTSNETTVPAVRQTRQSTAKNQGKRGKNSHINCGKDIGCLMDVSIATNILKIQDMQTIEAQEKNEQHTSFLTSKAVIYPKGKRTRRSLKDRKDEKQNDHTERSPKEKVSSSSNAVSPICTSDNSTKQLHKHGLSKSPFLRELNRLHTDEVGPVPAFKEVRRRREMSSVCVLFSNHLGGDIIKQQKKVLARLRVKVASSPSEATHFIADEFVRTRNMLETMALGKPVVTHLWLESCAQASCYIDEQKYILRDQKKEREIGFNMSVSLARARQGPLLQGKKVFITTNVKPSRAVVTALVLAACGQAVERIGRSIMACDKMPDDLLVVSCEEDYTTCVTLLEKGAEVYSSELLLNGMVIQKLEYHRHRLFVDHVKRTRSTLWLRNEQDHRFHPVAKNT
ncbi:uncharacterized protein [Aristolochia californica]|uniref:uncharacterized protein isoform X2 n=1 Tax=Aristolochia californica TaxID=171875 RepID=UPI0035DD28F9